jgi:hypothetical protein
MITSLDDMYIFITFALLAGRYPSSPSKHCGILPSQHTILPWQLLQTNYNNFRNVEILKRICFSVNENIELLGTIFEVKTSKLSNYLTNMCYSCACKPSNHPTQV